MKRANGTGSVYKRTDKKRRKPYVAMVTVGTNQQTGRPIRKSLGSFEKATDARKAIDEYCVNPTQQATKKITFGDMFDMMIRQKENMGVGVSSHDIAKKRCQHIWNTPIQDLRLVQLQDIVDTCSLSLESKRRIKITLNAVFRLAYSNDYIQKNYAELIQLPAYVKSDMHKPFTTEEMQILWSNTDNDVVRMLLVYCYTGARPIELLTMRIENVNLKERYMTGGVKTEAGKNRKIPIANCIYHFIKRWYDERIFTNELLLPINTYNTLSRKMKKVLATLHINEHKAHDTRHTFVTMCSNYEIEEVLIKRIVGHSRGTNITQTVYTHKTQNQLLQAVNKLPYGINMTVAPNEKVVATG